MEVQHALKKSIACLKEWQKGVDCEKNLTKIERYFSVIDDNLRDIRYYDEWRKISKMCHGCEDESQEVLTELRDLYNKMKGRKLKDDYDQSYDEILE